MLILFMLIPLTIIFLLIAVYAFFWAVNNKQFDDLDAPANIVLLDDEESEIIEQAKIDKENNESNK